jgi:pheromone shutdown protein TraB
MPCITIVPTSHIASESLRDVEKAIRQARPDCIAVELDLRRFIAMQARMPSFREAMRGAGALNMVTMLTFKKVQDWLGRKVGVMPGTEMLEAVKMAEEGGIHVEFIDRDIGITVQRIAAIPWTEKARLILSLVGGVALGGVAARLSRNPVKLDLRKVPPPELVEQVVASMKTGFPALYRALVQERDSYMARRLASLSGVHESIVAVVGAAHARGIRSRLERLSKDLRIVEII